MRPRAEMPNRAPAAGDYRWVVCCKKKEHTEDGKKKNGKKGEKKKKKVPSTGIELADVDWIV